MLNKLLSTNGYITVSEVRKTLSKLYRFELKWSFFPLIIKSQYNLVSHLLFTSKVWKTTFSNIRQIYSSTKNEHHSVDINMPNRSETESKEAYTSQYTRGFLLCSWHEHTYQQTISPTTTRELDIWGVIISWERHQSFG